MIDRIVRLALAWHDWRKRQQAQAAARSATPASVAAQHEAEAAA